jgi:hypothetical protein
VRRTDKCSFLVDAVLKPSKQEESHLSICASSANHPNTATIRFLWRWRGLWQLHHPSIHPTASRSRAKKEKKFSVDKFFLTKYHSSI